MNNNDVFGLNDMFDDMIKEEKNSSVNQNKKFVLGQFNSNKDAIFNSNEYDKIATCPINEFNILVNNVQKNSNTLYTDNDINNYQKVA